MLGAVRRPLPFLFLPSRSEDPTTKQNVRVPYSHMPPLLGLKSLLAFVSALFGEVKGLTLSPGAELPLVSFRPPHPMWGPYMCSHEIA